MKNDNDFVPGEEWKPPSLASDPDHCHSYPEPIAEGVSLESLIAKHRKYTDRWTGSSGYFACRELLTNTVLKQTNIQITQCMSLCLSSLSAERDPDLGGTKYSRPISQLVAFESWVDLLSMCQHLWSYSLFSEKDNR